MGVEMCHQSCCNYAKAVADAEQCDPEADREIQVQIKDNFHGIALPFILVTND
jgi:hypothetical protein